MLNKYQYKDRDYITDILNAKKFTSKFFSTELKLLSRHYRELGCNEVEIKNRLHEFCKRGMKKYNPAIHYKIINNAVSHGMNEHNKIVQIDSLTVSLPELNYIDTLELSHEYKRVVFTLLVLQRLFRSYLQIKDGETKSNEYYFGGYKNYRDLVSVAKITFDKRKKSKVKNIHDLVRLLHEKEIVEIANNGNIKLLFMYDIPTDDSNGIIVKEYNEIGYYYDLFHGENRVKECESCGVPIRPNGNRQEFCKVCSKQNELEKYRKYNKTRINHR
ncbi:hypothetical protein [Cytobacillus gottheilii]|uniref:hypothetical protein n=1 Tax=Cytobacillus gottheilii TaxID=859144 RepID=UPI0009BA6195|nr:hypothetical protein [Cytobacillus gottheilii]